jgi:hypothetical protein
MSPSESRGTTESVHRREAKSLTQNVNGKEVGRVSHALAPCKDAVFSANLQFAFFNFQSRRSSCRWAVLSS